MDYTDFYITLVNSIIFLGAMQENKGYSFEHSTQ